MMSALNMARTVFVVCLVAGLSIGILVHAFPIDAKYHGNGWFLCAFEPGVETPFSATIGNYCHFFVAGSKQGDEWKGHGSWVDEDWNPGPLNAVFTVTGGSFFCDSPGSPIIYQLHGYASVFVGKEYVGMYYIFMYFWDDPVRDRVGFCLYKDWWDTPPPPWMDPKNIYYFASSYDGLLKGKIKTKPSVCE